MRYARTTLQAIVGTLIFAALVAVMLVVMIERVERAVAGDECVEAGQVNDIRGSK
jgi:hypothetical protein